MKAWTRFSVQTYCGKCGETIYPQQSALVITLDGMKRKLVRCADCEGPAPPDLPRDDAPMQQRTSRMKPLTSGKPEWLPYRDE